MLHTAFTAFTAFTALVGCDVPIQLAPMGTISPPDRLRSAMPI